MSNPVDSEKRARNLAILIEQPAALSKALGRVERFLSDPSASLLLEEHGLSHKDLELIATHCRATSDAVMLHVLPDQNQDRTN